MKHLHRFKSIQEYLRCFWFFFLNTTICNNLEGEVRRYLYNFDRIHKK